jgi:hypothetical protein
MFALICGRRYFGSKLNRTIPLTKFSWEIQFCGHAFGSICSEMFLEFVKTNPEGMKILCSLIQHRKGNKTTFHNKLKRIW